jgi:protein-disulfide isomerase
MIADKTGLDINELASALDHPITTELLRRDIWDGMQLGLLGTPAFEIEGEVYMGHLPPHILRRIAELPK